MNRPTFTIVIANYNYGAFLSTAIRSVLNQDYKDYELLIIDGGSTDSSLDVIKGFEKDISYWVSEKDRGQSDAFNKGFKIAKGDFFFWLNADDILLPGTLKKASDYLSKNPECTWLAGNTITLDQDLTINWHIRGPKFYRPLVNYGHVYVYGPTSIFHRTLFEQSGGFDEDLNYTMDTDLWYRFVNMGFKFHRLNHYCWGLRIHSQSKTSHAFNDKPSDAFYKESEFIKQKNNHRPLKLVAYILILYKLLSGTLIKAKWDTIKNKGKKIVEYV